MNFDILIDLDREKKDFSRMERPTIDFIGEQCTRSYLNVLLRVNHGQTIYVFIY